MKDYQLLLMKMNDYYYYYYQLKNKINYQRVFMKIKDYLTVSSYKGYPKDL